MKQALDGLIGNKTEKEQPEAPAEQDIGMQLLANLSEIQASQAHQQAEIGQLRSFVFYLLSKDKAFVDNLESMQENEVAQELLQRVKKAGLVKDGKAKK